MKVGKHSLYINDKRDSVVVTDRATQLYAVYLRPDDEQYNTRGTNRLIIEPLTLADIIARLEDCHKFTYKCVAIPRLTNKTRR